MYRRSKLFLSLLAAVCCLSCGAPVDSDEEDGPSAVELQLLDKDWIKAESGPWGALEYRRFFLPLPKVWRETPPRNEPILWHLPNINEQRLQDLIAAGPFTEVEQKLWRETCRVEPDGEGVIIHPSKEFRWMLRRESRSLLYSWLARAEGNPAQTFAFSYPAATFKDWFLNCDLRPELVEALEHFLYPAGKSLCFADLDLLDEYLAAPEERAELLAVLHRQPCCELRLRLDRQSDLGRLSVYWGEWQRVDLVYGRMKKAVDSMRDPEVAVSRLIPRLPRSLLNTFPAIPENAEQPLPDCFWTAFNFFNLTPDPRFSTGPFIEEALLKYHDHVTDKPHYGDILLLVDAKGHPVHAAVYLAADFVYTKNGGHPTKPWVMMKIPDMKAAYPVSGHLREAYFRWNPDKSQTGASYLTVIPSAAVH